MNTIGTIEQFNPCEPKKWLNYVERFKFYLTANSVTDENKKRAVFMTVCGSATYDIIHSLFAPKSITEVDFCDIITKLTDHFAPKESTVVSRFKLHQRNQLPNESISTYIGELRIIIKDCGFKQDMVDEILRDRLVCGVRDDVLQHKLLSETNLTLKKAQDIAQAYEATLKNVCTLREHSTTNATNQIKLSNLPDRKGCSASGNRRNLCFRCNNDHSANNCEFKNARCNFCRRIGHIERACFMKRKQGSQLDKCSRANQKSVDVDDSQSNFTQTSNTRMTDVQNDFYEPCIYRVNHQGNTFKATVIMNGKPVLMEVDSGAAYSMCGIETFNAIFSEKKPEVHEFGLVLRDYQQNEIKTLGLCEIDVQYRHISAKLPLVVAKMNTSNLIGRNWFETLKISVIGINQVENFDERSRAMFKEFSEVFQESLGKFKGQPISLNLDPQSKPVLCKVRNLPFALKPKVEAELERLVNQGILEPIERPTWATPVVPVVKGDNTIRLCGDYRVTINKSLMKDVYPVPSVQQVLATLKGGQIFARLDLKQAYQQLTVDEDSAEAQTLITHKGAFKVNRLQFGVASAPQIFQRFMDTRLNGIPGVIPYFDDVLLVGKNADELEIRLRTTLKRFQEDGIRLRKDKCMFFVDEVKFLGFLITAQGISPTEDKVECIRRTPEPKTKQELQVFLGMLNFFHIFLQDKATVAEPLYRLLHNNIPWKWEKEERESFNKLKMILSSSACLVHYDENKPLVLTCDASPYGVGMVLSHLDVDGREQPIAFHCKTLSSTERNFSQLDREALAIITGIKKFHNYIYGRFVEIRTDHQPLLGIFGPKKAIPQVISPRMLRWALILASYDYNLVYVPGKQLPHADALISRLPADHPDMPSPPSPPAPEIYMLESCPEPSLTAEIVAAETKQDKLLSKIMNWTLKGWPENRKFLQEDVNPFWLKRNELSVYKDCLLWGSRVIIPPGRREQVLRVLHEAHPGVIRMKSLARSYVWWPRMDADIEKLVGICTSCQQNRHMPSKSQVHPWEEASRPWQRLHIDFAGPIQGNYLLIVVDSFSKWLDVQIVPSTSAHSAITVLRNLFATHGIPQVLVSDNGTAFTSQEFQDFVQKNLIRHSRIAPYHPASNGQPERMVQTTKEALKKMTCGDMKTKLVRFLLQQHITPHAVTGFSPAELLMRRKLHTRLDSFHPDCIKNRKEENNSLSQRSFSEGDIVHARMYGASPKWCPALVKSSLGPVSYRLQTEDGNMHHRHVDQMRRLYAQGNGVDPRLDEEEKTHQVESPDNRRNDFPSTSNPRLDEEERTHQEESPDNSRNDFPSTSNEGKQAKKAS